MNQNIRLFYLHNFLTDFQLHNAFLVIYFAEIIGSYTQAMAVISIVMVTSAAFEIPTGIMSDKIGRKWTLVFGSIFAALGISCYAAAHGILTLCAGAFLSGLSYCLFSGNNDAMLFDTLKADGKENQFHHYQGRTCSMFQLALALSAFSSIFLVDNNSLRLVFVLSIIPQIMAFIVSLFFVEPRTHEIKQQKNLAHLLTAIEKIKRNPRLLILTIAQAISHGAGESNFQFKTAFINSLWPMWAVGLYRALNHGLSFFGYWFSGSIVDRFKESRVLIFRELYIFVSQIIAVIISNIISPVLMLSGAFFFGPGNVARDNLLQKEFTDEQRATMGSFTSFAGSLVFTFVSLAIGIIADNFGINAAVVFGLIVCITSLPFYVKLLRKYI